MRRRRWVILTAVFVSIIIIAIGRGWQFSRANDRIRDYILSQMRPILGNSCTISQVRMSFSNVHLNEIAVKVPGQKIVITIKDLRIGYNVFRLLIKGIHAKAFSQDLLLKNPRVTFYSPISITDSTEKEGAQGDIVRSYFRKLQEIGFLSRASVVDGEIYYVPDSSNHLCLAHNLEGWLSTGALGLLQIRMEGKLFSSTNKNLFLEGQMNFQSGNVAAFHLKLDDMLLKDTVPYLPSKNISFKDGTLNADLNITSSIHQVSGFTLNGSLGVQNVAASLWSDKIVFHDGNFFVKVQDWNALLSDGHCLVNTDTLKLKGSIADILQPNFDLDLIADSLRIAEYSVLLGDKWRSRLQGTIQMRTRVTGHLDDLVAEISAASNRVVIDPLSLHDIFLSAKYQKKRIDVKMLRLNVDEISVHTSGNLEWEGDNPHMSATLDAEGNGATTLNRYFSAKLANAPCSIQLVFTGRPDAVTLDGELALKLISLQQDSIVIDQSLNMRNQVLQSNPKSNTASAMIAVKADFTGHETSFTFEINPAQKIIAALWPSAFTQILAKHSSVLIRMNGGPRTFSVHSLLSKNPQQSQANTLMTLDADCVRNGDLLTSNGRISLQPGSPYSANGNFFITKEKTRFTVKELKLADWMDANFTIVSGNELQGSCFMQKMPLTSLLYPFLPEITGVLDGDMSVKGTASEPDIRGTLRLYDSYIEKVGPYSSECAFTISRTSLNLQRLIWQSNNSSLLFANGSYAPQTDSLRFTVKGFGFDMANFVPTIFMGIRPVTGLSTVDIKVNGTLTQPDIAGTIQIKNGQVLTLPFDDFEFVCGKPSDSFTEPLQEPPGIHILSMKMSRKGFFEINGRGFIPIRSKDKMDVAVSGTGNFLSVLRDVTPYFHENNSIGQLSAHAGGPLGRPELIDASLTFYDGKMTFDSVVPQVTELKGTIQYKPDEHFLHVLALEGKMGGKWFKISNTLTRPDLAAIPLQNLVLSGDGLNLGVIALETSRQGVPLNITGLMENGVFGTLQLAGRSTGEKFYLAGPHDRPVFRGQINLSDFEFMFPFDESTTTSQKDPVVDLLLSAEWDVAVKTGKDVQYAKSMPGGIDNVYANLKLDEAISALDFSGQLNDSTFRINGRVHSTSGYLEYLDMTFRLDQADAEWDHSSLFPVVYGQARTTVTDSMGITSQVFLTVQTVDNTMDKKSVEDIVRQERKQGRWDEIRFKLSSDNPNLGNTEAQMLASLGYSLKTLPDKAIAVIGINTENYLLRPLYRPIERKIEQVFQLDYVRFSSRFTSNFLNANLNYNPELNTRLALLRSTKLILGKYLSKNLFLQYTGQVEAGVEYRFQEKGVGLHHTLGLEYHINPQLLLELEYDYNSLMLYKRDDARIMVRHWFPF